jgi:hypothetical protein
MKVCLIIDANLAHEFSADGLTSLSAVVLKRILRGEIKIATGGKNLTELRATPLEGLLKTFRDAGLLILYRDEDILREEGELHRKDICGSNDHHILALAITSGAHLVYSRDALLNADFRNAKIVPLRRGCSKKVLNNSNQTDSARQMGCCKCQPSGS